MPSDVSAYEILPQMDASSSAPQQKYARVLSIVAFGDVRNLDWDRIQTLISISAGRATKRLTLVLVSNAFAAKAEARTGLFPYVQHCVTTATSLAHTSVESMAVAIDVLLFGWSNLQLSAHMYDAVFSNSPYHVQEIIGNVSHLQVGPQVPKVPSYLDTDWNCTDEVAINVVSVNGTFDHLHLGHKNHLLLSAWLTAGTLLCAVSTASPSDASHKKLVHLSETFQRRQSAVRQFIETFQTAAKRPFELKVVPRQRYGPQVSERKLDAIVLSTESKQHGDIVNRLRIEAGLPPVKVFVVDVVQAAGAPFSLCDPAHLLATRMTSSSIRESLNERALKLILLNGFAGVGKYTIASQLATCLACADVEVRVVHNHLLMDLADAVRPRTAPTYQTFRRQLRELVFESIITDEHVSPGTIFVFTGNFSQSVVGRTAAKEYDTAASRCGALFIPVTLHCDIEELKRRVAFKGRSDTSSRKLVDPVRGVEIAAQKVLCTFEHAQALSLDVSLMSAEQAAERVAEHVQKVSKKG